MRTLSFPWEETITVRVVDDIGRTAEASVKILTFEGEPVENVMLAPKYVTAECDNDEIVINWTDEKHILAKYILIRVNDVDLDYIPVESLKATISNIESIEKIESIKVAWLDENLELGEWAEVELNCSEPINDEPVETGIASISSALLLAGGCAFILIICYKKYLP